MAVPSVSASTHKLNVTMKVARDQPQQQQLPLLQLPHQPLLFTMDQGARLEMMEGEVMLAKGENP